MLKEVGLAEKVGEALDRVGRFEGRLLGAAGCELCRQFGLRDEMMMKIQMQSVELSQQPDERKEKETNRVVELHLGNLLRTRALALSLDALGVVFARLVTHLEVSVALDLVLLLFFFVVVVGGLRSDRGNTGDFVGLRDVVGEGVLACTCGGEVGGEGGTRLPRGRKGREMRTTRERSARVTSGLRASLE